MRDTLEAKPVTTDVVVVGGGIAGMIAANRAAERGLRVQVFEQGKDPLYLCNSRFTGGVFHVAFHQPMRAPDDLMRIIREATAGEADAEMAEAVAESIGPAIRWLQAEGIRFIKAGKAEWQDWILAPPQFPRAGLHWPGRGGDVLLRQLETNLRRRGGTVQRGAEAYALAKDGEGFRISVKGRADLDGTLARTVVLADGGFQGNPDLLADLVTAHPERVRQRGAGTGRGAGLRMAEALGAAIVRSPCFYGHVLSQDCLHNDNLWPYPWIDELAGAGIVVDGAARRFADEGRGGVVLANAIARLSDPLSATAIFDEQIWSGPGRNMIVPANPLLEVHGCTIHKADSLRALAGMIGLDADALENTVRDYNAAYQAGSLTQLDPARQERKFRSFPIVAPPFRAIRVCAGVTYTMGGIAIDKQSRVIGQSRETISGLYAVGATTGGLEGGEAVGYVGGLVKSAATAFRAGDAIARDIFGYEA